VIKKIEHIGIAVQHLEDAEKIFSALLEQLPYKREEVASENVLTSFFKVGETKMELLKSLSPDSAIAKFIEKRGQGIHHIALDVEGIEDEIKRLVEKGFELIHLSPKDGADNKRIAFLHPKSTCSVLIELCEEKK